MIRAVAPGDLDQMLELCRLHAAHEGLRFDEDGQKQRWAPALFSRPAKLHGWVVAEPGAARLLGYMTAVVEFSTWRARDFVYMDTLYLREEARGRGLGRELVATLRAFAAGLGLDELQWQTPPGNQLGLGFYRRIGAAELEKRRFTLNFPQETLHAP